MKGKSLLFGLCLCLWTSLGWGQRVIEVPWYETTNTYMFDIIKMELTDEATVITGQVKYFPNEWFRVVGRTVLRGESGKEYKLLKAEGIKLNEQVFLPESGHPWMPERKRWITWKETTKRTGGFGESCWMRNRKSWKRRAIA